jgi:hypothetical protein
MYFVLNPDSFNMDRTTGASFLWQLTVNEKVEMPLFHFPVLSDFISAMSNNPRN